MVVPRTQCISVIDESLGNQARNNYNNNPPPSPWPQSVSSSAQAIQNDWNRFRSEYPNNNGNGREFWLLQPGRQFSDLLRPNNFINDSLTRTRTVARDNGSTSNRSDWFAICGLDTQPPGSYVSLWLDVSGSMRLSTVRASYDYFFERCAAADINVVLNVSDQGERWSVDQTVDFPPSASFSADPDFLTNFNVVEGVTIPYGGSATLSWIVFGDVTSAVINAGVGAVTDPSGTITVNPEATTQYQLTVTGPVGSQQRLVTVTVLPPPPPTVTFSASPTSFINPGSSTLSWDVSGISVDFLQIVGSGGDDSTYNVLNSPGLTGSIVVSPTDSTTYTITAKNFGGAQGSVTTEAVTVDVYQPVVANISANPNPITAGQSTTLTWSVTGDASTASISPNITNNGQVLLSSSASVSPSVSTTYTLTASGLGGNDTAEVIVQVCQIPQISTTFPSTLDYGDTPSVTVSYRNATSVAQINAVYTDVRGVVTTGTINLTLSASDKNNAETTAEVDLNIPWNNFGPERIEYSLSAAGCGGNVNTEGVIVEVDIDQTPDAINIPDSRNVVPEDQVEAPDTDTVLSDPIVIEDIDIPVEIKSNRPIQVRFDDDDPNLESNWNNLRQIT